MSQSLFLSLDGLDGTGKSTQCQLLADWLRSQQVPVVACVDPGGTPVGQKLREMVLFGRDHGIATTTEAFLFMAARAQLVAEVIRPAIDRGQVVISDRYLLANVVYQGHAGGMDPDQLWRIGVVATGGVEPDLTLIFDVPLDVARSRRGQSLDLIESRGLDYHARVRDGFLLEASRQPTRYQVIDSTPSMEIVHEAVRRTVLPLLAERGWILSEGR